ncbi:hypothetical protein KAU11_09465 [Candidatus Babeliales bacterium]|nr:hypothetical protein [Candidatus Babeliales bacterium]
MSLKNKKEASFKSVKNLSKTTAVISTTILPSEVNMFEIPYTEEGKSTGVERFQEYLFDQEANTIVNLSVVGSEEVRPLGKLKCKITSPKTEESQADYTGTIR